MKTGKIKLYTIRLALPFLYTISAYNKAEAIRDAKDRAVRDAQGLTSQSLSFDVMNCKEVKQK